MASRELDIHTGKPRTRTEVATEWAVWHFAELAGITGPGLLAVTINGWFATASAVVAAGWAVHETRTRREQARIRDRRALAATGTPAEDTEPAEDPGTDGAGEDKGVSA
ncbi:hypothetical protein [Amycolatopsis aidingensis]|uniref:hypothetical protein n=1 Tax=Amycolatopsis aidingensis TaxID=2842453 RepID=UPI001C0BE1A5|nr:hypothetical protein [Amycolatopsis aidingensis]